MDGYSGRPVATALVPVAITTAKFVECWLDGSGEIALQGVDCGLPVTRLTAEE